VKARAKLQIIREDVERSWQDENSQIFLREHLLPLIDLAGEIDRIERQFEASLPSPPDEGY
jgi:hypothetical protein